MSPLVKVSPSKNGHRGYWRRMRPQETEVTDREALARYGAIGAGRSCAGKEGEPCDFRPMGRKSSQRSTSLKEHMRRYGHEEAR
jgi:hypothetical protein